jgi:2'-5' RNA ligase
MYIWIGINVDDQLKKIKERSFAIEKKLGFKNSNFTLPLHISLKISFEVDDSVYSSVIRTIAEYYQKLNAFEVDVKGIENHEEIIWIRMLSNESINKIHDDLNEILKNKFNVGLHEYDLDYKFHTTLFMDNDSEIIDKAYDLIRNEDLPSKLIVNKFVIGTSESGKLGSYSVNNTVIVER